jgi:hypothetical protein
MRILATLIRRLHEQISAEKAQLKFHPVHQQTNTIQNDSNFLKEEQDQRL